VVFDNHHDRRVAVTLPVDAVEVDAVLAAFGFHLARSSHQSPDVLAALDFPIVFEQVQYQDCHHDAFAEHLSLVQLKVEPWHVPPII
jgi:hypothetical protein